MFRFSLTAIQHFSSCSWWISAFHGNNSVLLRNNAILLLPEQECSYFSPCLTVCPVMALVAVPSGFVVFCVSVSHLFLCVRLPSFTLLSLCSQPMGSFPTLLSWSSSPTLCSLFGFDCVQVSVSIFDSLFAKSFLYSAQPVSVLLCASALSSVNRVTFYTFVYFFSHLPGGFFSGLSTCCVL